MFFTDSYSKELFVSPFGRNSNLCGLQLTNPCQDISFTVIQRANENDIVKIDGSFQRNSCFEAKPLTEVAHGILVTKNLSFTGYNGTPVIQKCNIGDDVFLRVVTVGNELKKLTSIRLEGIHFEGVALAVLQKGRIHIENCTVNNITTTPILDALFNHKSVGDISISNTVVINCKHVIGTTYFDKLNIFITMSNFTGTAGHRTNRQRSTAIGVLSDTMRLSQSYIDLKAFRSLFQEFTNAIWLDIQGTARSRIHIIDCKFLRNGPKWAGWWYPETKYSDSDYRGSALRLYAPLHNLLGVSIVNSKLEDNCAHLGGAVYIDSWMGVLSLENCTIRNNFAVISGGALMIQGGHTMLRNCALDNNAAGSNISFNENIRTFVFIKNSGGALAIHKGFGKIERCEFKNNTAAAFGGTILLESEGIPFEVFDSTFLGPSQTVVIPKEGSIYYAFSDAVMKNVTFISPHMEELASSVIYQNGERQPKQVLCVRSSNLICPTGSNVRLMANVLKKGARLRYPGFLSLMTYCSPCPVRQYTLNSASLNMDIDKYSAGSGQGYRISNTKCMSCPFGGKCQNNIVAKRNFWGYKYNGGREVEFEFVPCPGYCCNNEDTCRSFNSCSRTRAGILCGKCKTGFTESLLSSVCISERNCRAENCWIFLVVASLGYVILFMYTSELSAIVKLLLFKPNFRKLMARFRRKNSVDPKQILLLKNPIKCHELDPCKQQDTPSFSTGMLKIVFFFYQVIHLYHVYDTEQGIPKPLETGKSILLSIFNLCPQGSNFHEFWCPFKGLTPVLKVLLKSCFPCILITTVLLLYILHHCVHYLKRKF